MASPSQRAAGGRNAPRFRLRASHSVRIRLHVSHRGQRSWEPPDKEADLLFERDLFPAGPVASAPAVASEPGARKRR